MRDSRPLRHRLISGGPKFVSAHLENFSTAPCHCEKRMINVCIDEDSKPLEGRMKFTTKCQESAIIRRYIDFPKLLHLLVSKRLFLPSLGLLRERDRFECATFPRGRYSHLSEPILKTYARDLEDLLPEPFCQREGGRPAATDHYSSLVEGTPRAEIEKCVWELEREKLLERVVCSCW